VDVNLVVSFLPFPDGIGYKDDGEEVVGIGEDSHDGEILLHQLDSSTKYILFSSHVYKCLLTIQ
jgi:hypothetical protein